MARSRNDEPQLELREIQGDILVGLPKDFQWFVFFQITDVAEFGKFVARALLPRISTAARVKEWQFQNPPTKGSRLGPERVGLNTGFTKLGLDKLTLPNRHNIADAAFTQGLAARSRDLNDPTTGVGSVANWKVGGPNNTPDGIILIAGRTQAAVDGEHDDLVDLAAAGGWKIVYEECGIKRKHPDHRGHEHFGFRDGVSQPGIRGRIDHTFAGKIFLQDGRNPRNPGQGSPGSDLLWPGEFIFGYPGQDPTDLEKPGIVVTGGTDWMKNGSFMVLRRLNQLVPEFNAFIESAARKSGMDAELFGARMVGRWKSGAPLSIAPLRDDPNLGEDETRNNDFEFDNDPDGRRCPFAAHIRKAYPRNDVTRAGQKAPTGFYRRRLSEADTQTHRILRRGIPFGPDPSDEERRTGKTSTERGLMFVCYQTSIVRQFEFILKNWINNPDFAPSGRKPGFDPLLGQSPSHAPRPVKGLTVGSPAGEHNPQTLLPTDFIFPTGGGYFFMPSMRTFRRYIAARG